MNDKVLDPLLTTEEVMKQLKCAKGTVWHLCQRGQIRHTRPYGRILVRQSDLDRFVNSAIREARA